MEKKKTGGRARQFEPHKAVKVQIFVPENDVQMSVAVAKRAIMNRYKALQDGGCVKHEFEPETIQLSEEDMIEFAEWIADSKLHGYSKQLYEAMIRHKVSTTKELLQLWKEQKPKTLYYE